MKRRAPLTRAAPLARSSLHRHRDVRARVARTGAAQAFREAVLARAGATFDGHTLVTSGRCDVGSPGCTSKATQAHHRKMRSAGGSHDPTNGLAVCVMCHTYIHAHVAQSYEKGWLISRHDDGTKGES